MMLAMTPAAPSRQSLDAHRAYPNTRLKIVSTCLVW